MTTWPDVARWAAGALPHPELARARAQDAVIDTVACIVTGRGTPAARAAPAVGGGSVAMAAFAMATAAHALDYDDYDRPSVGHPSAVLVPVHLTLGGTGAAVLEAYVVGLEAIDRMGEVANPAQYEAGWHATATLGAIGAAAAAGRLLCLDAARMLAALSLATGTAVGLKVQFGSWAKPLNAGFAALHGVMAEPAATLDAGDPASLTGLLQRFPTLDDTVPVRAWLECAA